MIRKLAKACLAVLMVMVVVAPAGAQQQAQGMDVPVTKVVLYSSGVGYFEHNGSVNGDVTTQLMFKADQINDVLKSMVLFDFNKGTVSSVSYASRDPLTRALQSFAIDLSGDPDFVMILKQLRGAEVIVKGPQELQGKLLNVELKEKTVPVGGAVTIIKEVVLHLVENGSIRTIPMADVSAISLKDERLAGELSRALELLMEAHNTTRKPVEIAFSGQGKRRVRIGYISEAPIWKTSYRLALADEEPRLQGWAIVENTSDQDWKDVSLSLVSGRPISFVQDLYTPLYMPRPVVVPELYKSLVPPDYSVGLPANGPVKFGELAQAQPRNGAGFRGSALAGGERAGDDIALNKSVANGTVDLGRSIQSAASADKMGELFNFTIKDAVTLPRRRSAMLPIINSPVKAERVSIYNQAVLARNPLNGAYLINTTEMKLPEGPVTVFDGGAYAGDGRLGVLVPGEKRLISFAIDLAVTVDPSVKSDTQLLAGKIVRGVLELRRLAEFEQTYAILNKADEARQMVVEHPFRAERKLVEPAEFIEKLPDLYRFGLNVPAGKKVDFKVTEQQTLVETVALLGQSPESLLIYAKTGKIRPAVAEALTKAAELKRAVEDTQRQLAEKQAQLQKIETGQDRLRKNIESVGRDSDLGRRYIKTLMAEEDQIEQLRKDIDELQKKLQEQRKGFEDFLVGLNVE